MSDPGIKKVIPTKFFACGVLISCVLIKEISDTGIKMFLPSTFFACGELIYSVLRRKLLLSRGVRIQGEIAI